MKVIKDKIGIRSIDFAVIMASVMLILFLLGIFVGRQTIINQMRDVGVQTLCALL